MPKSTSHQPTSRRETPPDRPVTARPLVLFRIDSPLVTGEFVRHPNGKEELALHLPKHTFSHGAWRSLLGALLDVQAHLQRVSRTFTITQPPAQESESRKKVDHEQN